MAAPHGPGTVLAAGAAELDLTISPDRYTCLERFLALVDEWRPRVQLTGVDSTEAAAVLVVGAFCILPFVPESGRLVDLGSGAGVPGVPLAILRPGLRVVLVDAARKKTAFLEIVARELALSNVDVVQMRAEALGRDPAHRGQYDVVTARALAPVRVLAEYTLPLLRAGGMAVLPKGPGAAHEVGEAARALTLLGGEAAVRAAGSQLCSPTVLLKKVVEAPARYPRRAGVPARRPL
ncbi:MAG TPA: 16S rRNA (guanine(527)-N(7))-methyltransferase RsmG [bacterium]|nr:16S rRNA (guanine(527)-N(7))-methyltransferase RsmG [bacterium]